MFAGVLLTGASVPAMRTAVGPVRTNGEGGKSPAFAADASGSVLTAIVEDPFLQEALAWLAQLRAEGNTLVWLPSYIATAAPHEAWL